MLKIIMILLFSFLINPISHAGISYRSDGFSDPKSIWVHIKILHNTRASNGNSLISEVQVIESLSGNYTENKNLNVSWKFYNDEDDRSGSNQVMYESYSDGIKFHKVNSEWIVNLKHNDNSWSIDIEQSHPISQLIEIRNLIEQHKKDLKKNSTN